MEWCSKATADHSTDRGVTTLLSPAYGGRCHMPGTWKKLCGETFVLIEGIVLAPITTLSAQRTQATRNPYCPLGLFMAGLGRLSLEVPGGCLG